ncbi:hypothetical protein OESDEN_22765, partial [Oesophagostomum dentatum]
SMPKLSTDNAEAAIVPDYQDRTAEVVVELEKGTVHLLPFLSVQQQVEQGYGFERFVFLCYALNLLHKCKLPFEENVREFGNTRQKERAASIRENQ